MRSAILALTLLVAMTTIARAQAARGATEPAAATPWPSETAPVQVPEPSAKAMAYYRSGVALWLLDTAWELIFPALVLFTGLSGRLRDWATVMGRKWVFIIAVYFVLFSIVAFVMDLPRSYYVDFVREHAYGLSNQTFAKWFGDSLKGLLIGMIMGVLFLWIPYLLLRKSPRRWWLYTGLLTAPLLCLVLLVAPVWIEPLFNTFGPMKDKALEGQILALAERAGIEGGRVYEVDKSVDTKALDAYVAGLWNTKRIVLWDTIIARLDERELLFVMGHEMGHYVLGHIWKLVVLFPTLVLVVLFVIYRTAGWLMSRYPLRFGFDTLSDVASLPLILLLFNLYFFLVTPIPLAFARHFEHEADRFGLEITRANRPAAMAFVKLQEDNLTNPHPHWLVRLWRSSHPTLAERIEFANSYRPWEHHQPLKYEHLFR
jgi:STE24 endopeptidase